jgi:TusA-related sulfurtransferase
VGANRLCASLKTCKALKSVTPGDFLEVHCTDALSVIDIPNLIRETGDKVEITARRREEDRVLDREARTRAKRFVGWPSSSQSPGRPAAGVILPCLGILKENNRRLRR